MRNGFRAGVAATALVLGWSLAVPAAAQDGASAVDADAGAIVVTGQRLSNRRALEAKRNADVVMDVIAADDLDKLPDQNVAEAVSRIPGATAFQDEGTGLYVGLRGLNQEFVNLTLEGLEISSAARTFDQNLKGANLEAVPSSFLSRVEVAKSATPEFDADAIAGTVNLVTASPLDQRKPWTILGGSVGQYTVDVPPADRAPSYKVNGSIGRTFGGDRFGISLAAYYTRRRRDDLKPEAFFGSGASVDVLPSEVGGFFYQRDEESYGGSGKIEFRPDPALKLFAALVYFDSNVDQDKTKHALYGATSNAAAGTFSKAYGTLRADRVNYGVDGSLTGQAGFDWSLSAADTVTARGSLSTSRAYQDDARVDFATGKVASGRYAFNGRYYDYTIDAATYPAFIDPSKYGFNGYRHFADRLEKDVGAARIDWEHRAPGAIGLSFKTGAKFKRTANDYSARNFRWRSPISDPGFAGHISVADWNFPYTNNPQILYADAAAIAAAAEALGASGFSKVDSVIVNGSDFNISEQVAAGYGELRYTGALVEVIGGLRYEQTLIRARNRYNQKEDAAFVLTRQSYGDLLPSLAINYKPIPGVILRLGASRTLGRPDIRDLARGETPPNDNGIYTRGNPELKPRRADNLDLSFEYYFDDGRSGVSLGLFRKDITDEIYDLQTPYQFQGTLGPVNSYFIQPANAGKARVQGVEFSLVEDKMAFLPGPLANLGFTGNVTINDGFIRLIDATGGVARTTTPEGFAKFVANATLYYQDSRLSARAAWRHVGEQNQQLSIDGSADLVLDPYEQVDLHFGYKLLRNVELTADVWNLLGDHQTFTNVNRVAGPANYFETVEYGRAFWLGVNLKF